MQSRKPKSEKAEIRTGSNLTVRQYRVEDVESCRKLWEELTEWHREIYHDPSIGGLNPGRYFDDHLDRVGANNVWVAEAGGRVVGFAGLIPGERSSELEPIVIETAYRGRGVGRRLAEHIVDAARRRGLQQVKVRPVARNLEAIRFFHAMGFDIVGHLELILDFENQSKWKAGLTVADRSFRV